MKKSDRFEASLTEDGRYRLLVDAITDYAIYMLDPCGNITSWNSGAVRLKGYEEIEVVGQHFSMFYTDDENQAGLPTRVLEVAAREGRFESEGWRVRKGGARFWAHVVIDPIWDRSGGLVGFAKITRDLTERRGAGEALRQSEERLTLLVQSVTDYALYLLDLDGLVISWNSGAELIKGYRSDEIIGKHFSLFYTQEDRANNEPEKALETAAREGRFEQQGWRVRKDGGVFRAAMVITPVRDYTGIIGFAKVIRDVTASIRAQAELQRARDALFQSQKMEAVGQLTGGIAHDFNNILTVILGGLEIMQTRLPVDPGVTPLLHNALNAAQQGKWLTQRMLAFARRQDLKPQITDLPALVHSMTDLLQRSLGPSIVIKAVMPPSLPTILVDPHQMELALLNLTMNARDAMPDGGPIIIAAREEATTAKQCGVARSGHYVCLSVTDTGDGMDKTTISRAIEPFFTTKAVGEGTGLGLSMAHGFAEQSGGQFILRSHKGEGTVAEFWFPVSEGHAKPCAKPEEALLAGQSERNLVIKNPLVVLAVDDDRLALMNLTSMLNAQGHRVFTATSGQQALDLIQREALIDVVIIDHTLAEMTGQELAEAIKTDWPSLPIIFATPLADPTVQQLPKPLREEDLANALAGLVRTSNTCAAESHQNESIVQMSI